jgi:thiamine biosynthesis lipoprotein
MKKYGLLILLFLAAFVTGCSKSGTVQKTETIMGTEVTVTVVAKNAGEGVEAIGAAMAEIKRLDAMMSLYKDDSEISRVNAAAGKNPVKVSAEMIEVAEQAAEISELTGGAFDATIGPLVVLWQMRLKEGKVPTDQELARIRPLVGHRNVVVDRRASTLFLKKPGMVLDFGGIAKGYAADRAGEVLKKRSVQNAIVAVAGDIRAMGRRQEGKPWRIGVQHPREKDKTLTVLELSDKSLSTSGDYERFRIVESKRYHHIIDPRTGKPSEGLISVTIVGDKGAAIDPLTTALFILGKDEGMKIVKKLGLEAIFVAGKGEIASTEGIRLHQ